MTAQDQIDSRYNTDEGWSLFSDSECITCGASKGVLATECQDVCLDDSLSGHSSSIRFSAFDPKGTTAADMAHILLSCAAGLQHSSGVSSVLLANLRRSIALTKSMVNIERYNPAMAIAAAMRGLLTASVLDMLVFAAGRDLLEVRLDNVSASASCTISPNTLDTQQCMDSSQRLILDPKDRVLKNYQQADDSRHPMGYLQRFLSPQSREIINNSGAPLVIYMSDAVQFRNIRSGGDGELGNFFSRQLLINYFVSLSWTEATSVVHDLFATVILCESLDDCSDLNNSLDNILSSTIVSDGSLAEGRLCSAYERMISDVKTDREDRQVCVACFYCTLYYNILTNF